MNRKLESLLIKTSAIELLTSPKRTNENSFWQNKLSSNA